MALSLAALIGAAAPPVAMLSGDAGLNAAVMAFAIAVLSAP